MTGWQIRPHDVLVFQASKDPDRRYECVAVDGGRVTLRTWHGDQRTESGHDRAELAALDPCPYAVTVMMNTPDPFARRRREVPARAHVTEPVTDVTALTRHVTDVTDTVTPSVTGRACECGCGAPVISTHPAAKYAGPACRKRANRRKRG